MKILAILILACSMVSCNTSRESIVDSAIVIAQKAPVAKASQDSILTAVEDIEENADKLELSQENLENAETTLAVVLGLVTKIVATNPKAAKDLQDVHTYVSVAKDSLEIAIPAIRESTKEIRTQVKKTTAIIEMAIEESKSIVDNTSGVENTESEFMAWSFDIFGGLFGGIGKILSVMLGLGVAYVVVVHLPPLLMALKSITGFFIPKRDYDQANLLQEAMENPNFNNVSNLASSMRAKRSGEAAWQYAKRKRAKTRGSGHESVDPDPDDLGIEEDT